MFNDTLQDIITSGYRESRVWVLDNRVYIMVRNAEGDTKTFEIINNELFAIKE